MARERVTYNRLGEAVRVEGEVLGPYRPDRKRAREVLVVRGEKGHTEVPADLVLEREVIA
jgi:hypothetical protein